LLPGSDFSRKFELCSFRLLQHNRPTATFRIAENSRRAAVNLPTRDEARRIVAMATPFCWVDQYSSARMMVSTRVVSSGAAGSSEPPFMSRA
jgi:hypothetical protein